MTDRNDQNQQNDNEGELTESVKTVGSFVGDLGRMLLIAVVLIYFVIRPFVAEPFIVSGVSMVPNFQHRDYLIVQKLSYRFGDVQRGDVVILRYPKDPKQYFVKRVIGLPGEQVGIVGGEVKITNKEHPEGFLLDEPYLEEGVSSGNPQFTILEDDQYFVMGDNRGQSSDSRAWGTLPGEMIVGKAWLRVLPFSNAGMIPHERYE